MFKTIKLTQTKTYLSGRSEVAEFHIPIDKISMIADQKLYLIGTGVPLEVDQSASQIIELVKWVESSEMRELMRLYDEAMSWGLDKSEKKESKVRSSLTELMDVDSGDAKNPNDPSYWENAQMMIDGIPVDLQVGELTEVWENVTIEVVEKPNGEVSLAWKRQPNSKCVYKKGDDDEWESDSGSFMS